MSERSEENQSLRGMWSTASLWTCSITSAGSSISSLLSAIQQSISPPISHPDPLLNPQPLFYYMASKLEELKQKLLNQQALREKAILDISSAPPQLVASAQPKEHEPGQVSEEASPGPEEMMSAQRPESAGQSIEEQRQQPSPVNEKPDKVADSPHDQVLPEKGHIVELEAGVSEEIEELKSVEKVQQSKASKHDSKDELVQQKRQEGLFRSKSNDEPNLQLHDKPNLSCSIQEEVKPHSSLPSHEKPLESQSKQEKKQQKIELKQLEKIYRCIRNLKSAVKGLEIVQEKMAESPGLRGRLEVYLKELSAYQGHQ